MIGMSFGAFLTLLILGLISGLVMHFLIRYRLMAGADGFFAKWIAGWIGAWLGSPVIGHWWFTIQSIHIIPALIGAFVGALTVPFLVKVLAGIQIPRATTSSVAPELFRKAS